LTVSAYLKEANNGWELLGIAESQDRAKDLRVAARMTELRNEDHDQTGYSPNAVDVGHHAC